MREQIRNGVFETNSSTCHTVVVPRHQMDPIERLSYYDIYSWNGAYQFNRGVIDMIANLGDRLAYMYMLVLYHLRRERINNKRKETVEQETPYWKLTQEDFDKIRSEVDDFDKKIISILSEVPLDVPRYKEAGNMMEMVSEMLSYLYNCVILGQIDQKTDHFKGESWIEHPEEQEEFAKRILIDDDLLSRYLLDNESYATVCGDEYNGAYVRKVGFAYDYPSEYAVQNGKKGPTFKERVDELMEDYEIFR